MVQTTCHGHGSEEDYLLSTFEDSNVSVLMDSNMNLAVTGLDIGRILYFATLQSFVLID